MKFQYAADPVDALVPLFLETADSSTLRQIGTGVFVEFWSQPLLLTVAHVIDEKQHGELVAPMAGGMDRVDGYIAHIDLLPEGSRKDDPIDIAYCRLTSICATRLCHHFKPLHQSRLQLVPNALNLGVCSVYGYPVSKAKQLAGSYTSESATFRGVAGDQSDYDVLKLSPEFNIVIRFHKKRVVDRNLKRINHISPRGMSGGGIFAWPTNHELSEDWSLPKLVGLFHSYCEADGLLVGSSLVSVVAAIQLGQMKSFTESHAR